MRTRLKRVAYLLLMSIICINADTSLSKESSVIIKGDFNGDGVTDILTRNKDTGNLYTVLVTAEGTSSTFNKILSRITDSKWTILYTGNFNNDGTTDVLLQRKADGNIYTALLGEDGKSATLNKVAGRISSDNWIIHYAEDFNGDGVTDVLLQRKTDGNIYTLLLDSTGTSATLNKIVNRLFPAIWEILYSGDFNGDEVTDILVQRKTDKNLYTIIVSSDGTSATLKKIVSRLSNWSILDTKHLNSDGRTDILAQRDSDGNLYTILLNSTGTSATLNKVVGRLLSSEWDFLKTGDYNNDGVSDILARRKSDGNLYTILLNSTGTSASLNKIISKLSSSDWDVLNSIDLNGDDIDDLLLHNKISGHLYTFLLNATGTAGTFKKIVSGIQSSKWIILDASKYNNDTVNDVLVQRKSDGNVYTILLNNDGTASRLNKVIGRLASSTWEVAVSKINIGVVGVEAVNNLGRVVKESFNGYTLQVFSTKVLSESEELSLSTIAVYGIINNQSTGALLKINTNYINSDISVAIFKDDILIQNSKIFKVIDGQPINFGDIFI